jgi:cation transporter-like permease
VTQHKSALQMAAPILAVGATMALRKIMNGGYRQFTGHRPPDPNAAGTPIVQAMVWAVTTAAAAALVEVLIYRLTAEPDDVSAD